MRRTASEILSDLEMRVARLERESAFGKKQIHNKIYYHNDQNRAWGNPPPRRQAPSLPPYNPILKVLARLERNYDIKFDKRSLSRRTLSTQVSHYDPKQIERYLKPNSGISKDSIPSLDLYTFDGEKHTVFFTFVP